MSDASRKQTAEDKPRFLYRGVNAHMEDRALEPKRKGPFEHTFERHDYSNIKHDGNATYGPSVPNAVLGHQLDLEEARKSGISTTPKLERARFYALGNGRHSRGHIFKFDRNLLAAHGVCEYVVAKSVTVPHVPEDEEVILVARDGGSLPEQIVVGDPEEVTAVGQDVD